MSLRVLLPLTLCAAATARVNFRGTGQLHEAEVDADLLREIALSDRDLAEYEDGLRHMFSAMPKNSYGNLGHQAVRHTLHRFFVHRHAWWLRGFELDATNGNVTGVEDKDRVPDLLQQAFEKVSVEKGANLHALAALAAAVDVLVTRESRAHLQDCYQAEQVSVDSMLDREAARGISHTYFMSFILEHNWTVENKEDLLRKNQIFEARYPLYKNASGWLYKVFSKALGGEQSIDFNKTLQVANRIGEQYHDLNDVECGELSSALQAVESRKPGRVRLSVFYNMSLHSHWKFTESVDTLRNLGALDEADPQQKYVLISNYALARPNCVNASNIYEICCMNACEGIQQHVEKQVSDATATVEHLLAALESLEGVKVPRIEYALRRRLEQVAESHGGHVPLHGRLFKQWLHHVFPLDCPYPHEAGTTNPGAWTGQDSDQATDEEMRKHVEADTCSIAADGHLDCGEESAELPWSSAEELLIVGPIAPRFKEKKEDTSMPSMEVLTGLHLLLVALVALPVVSWGTKRGQQPQGLVTRRALAVSGTLAAAGLASCLGLLDPRIAALGAVGGAAANLVSHHTATCRGAAKLPLVAKVV